MKVVGDKILEVRTDRQTDGQTHRHIEVKVVGDKILTRGRVWGLIIWAPAIP